MMGFGMGPGMMGWYGGFGGIGGLGGFGMIFGMLFWVGLLALVIWGIGNWASLGSPARHTESALDVLKRRYASGDISRAEFEAARKDLA